MTCIRRIPALLITGVALCGAVAGCADRGRPVSSGPKDPKRMSPTELQEFVSTNAAVAGANAGAAMTMLPAEPDAVAVPKVVPPPARSQGKTVAINTVVSIPEPARRTMPAAVRIEKVTSDKYYETEEEAKWDALKVAVRKIAEKLQTLDPPIVAPVDKNRIWNEFVSHSSAKAVPLSELEKEALRDSKAGANRVRYEFDVEISEPQLRGLRAEGRVTSVAPVVIGGLVFAAVASVLLRLTGAAAAAVRRS